MDDLFFGVKRAHLGVNAWALGRLKEFGVTPARFDLMRMIYERNFRWVQSELRHRLGVARATISRMLRSLEKLGWIERKPNPWDRRTRDCVLTYEGRRVVATVMSTLIWPKVIAKVVDAALGGDVEKERKQVEWLARRLVIAFAPHRASALVGVSCEGQFFWPDRGR
jgi:DNA-binding MarR family transcriptional regulator